MKNVVAKPTYMDPIRTYFTSKDINHMLPRGIDLGTYAGLKANALRVYARLRDKTMPPGNPWPDTQVETFYNWIKDDCPRGIGGPRVMALTEGNVSRLRENLTEVVEDTAKFDKLKKAFKTIKERDPDHPQSYFQLAGIHWLPGGGSGVYYCRHHENAYNPWHRAYLQQFEDALRSVDGCKDVTLPYWDITDPVIPPALYEEPFRSYVLPRELRSISGAVYPKGYDTFTGREGQAAGRNDADTVLNNINTVFKIPENIKQALGHSWWERFNGWDCSVPHESPSTCRTQDGIIMAHDAGHNSIGTTMGNQDIAAFDPIFWFFHCNWDRVWWQWQQHYGATNLDSFKTHLKGPADWLTDPVLNTLKPFPQHADQTIDLNGTFAVEYTSPASASAIDAVAPRVASISASSAFSVSKDARLSARVKGIDRLKIPGSFNVALKVGGKTISTKAFFQSTSSKSCDSCKKTGIVNFDFVHDRDELLGGEITASIELLIAQDDGYLGAIPNRAVGDPTINIRLLMDG